MITNYKLASSYPTEYCLKGFLGFANVYAMRVNLSVAIVYMAGNNKTGDSLGLEGERTFGWSDKQQVRPLIIGHQ